MGKISKRWNSKTFTDSFIEANPTCTEEQRGLIRGIFVGYCIAKNKADISEAEAHKLVSHLQEMQRIAKNMQAVAR